MNQSDKEEQTYRRSEFLENSLASKLYKELKESERQLRTQMLQRARVSSDTSVRESVAKLDVVTSILGEIDGKG